MTAEEKLIENGFSDIVIFQDYSYDDALIGVTHDNRAVYDYEKMRWYLVEQDGFTIEEATEWIDYNTIRALPYAGEDGPIVMYPLEDT